MNKNNYFLCVVSAKTKTIDSIYLFRSEFRADLKKKEHLFFMVLKYDFFSTYPPMWILNTVVNAGEIGALLNMNIHLSSTGDSKFGQHWPGKVPR